MENSFTNINIIRAHSLKESKQKKGSRKEEGREGKKGKEIEGGVSHFYKQLLLGSVVSISQRKGERGLKWRRKVPICEVYVQHIKLLNFECRKNNHVKNTLQTYMNSKSSENWRILLQCSISHLESIACLL